MTTLGLNDLTELMNFYRNQTPSSPAWFQSIDQVVGVLLALEIQRAEEAARSQQSSGEPAA
jgi:hypothetical protein